MAAAKSAVRAAAGSWGERSLTLLDAEDRLSVACEKGTTEDQVLLRLRAVYQVNPVMHGTTALASAFLLFPWLGLFYSGFQESKRGSWLKRLDGTRS